MAASRKETHWAATGSSRLCLLYHSVSLRGDLGEEKRWIWAPSAGKSFKKCVPSVYSNNGHLFIAAVEFLGCDSLVLCVYLQFLIMSAFVAGVLPGLTQQSFCNRWHLNVHYCPSQSLGISLSLFVYLNLSHLYVSNLFSPCWVMPERKKLHSLEVQEFMFLDEIWFCE